MTQVPTFHRRDDPSVAAARARERMRALSRRAFDGERRSRALPVFSLTALLLAGLLVYYNTTRFGGDDGHAVKPACAHACKTHKK